VIVYIFWHWPERIEGYEDGLVEFHRRLAASGSWGLVASATYRVEALPWLGGPAGYEDWYVVGGFGDLEALNQKAVGPALRDYHDRPALAAAGGVGGLYAVHSGAFDVDAEAVTWLAKPKGTPYPDFYASLPPTRFLLRRQMVLGPAPEFCAAGEVPGGLISHRSRLHAELPQI
jgi:hypothetical protein